MFTTETLELKVNILAGEPLTDNRESFNLVLYVVLLCFIQMNLCEQTAIQFHVDPLAYSFAWENQVLQDCITHGFQRADPGTLLLVFCMAFFKLAEAEFSSEP